MGVEVTIRDETTSGEVLRELALQLEAERTTVRDLIDARVRSEVRAHNAGPHRLPFAGLVQPTASERELNGTREPRRIDAERQVAVAQQAFARGAVLLLVDDRQRTEPEEELVLTPETTVTFLKLTPLVGG